MASLDQLPEDVLLLIFNHLNVQDVLCVRRTSKYLCDLSCSLSLWRSIYSQLSRLLPLARAPSFISSDIPDSMHTLRRQYEQSCINAVRLARNWGSDEPVPTECWLIRGARSVEKIQLLGEGRWMLALVNERQVVLYDLLPRKERVGGATGRFPEGQNPKRRAKQPMRVFKKAQKFSVFTRAGGVGDFCTFESWLQEDELRVIISWRGERTSTDFLRVSLSESGLSSSVSNWGSRRDFEVFHSVNALSTRRSLAISLNERMAVVDDSNGLLRVFNWDTCEDRVISTWCPSPATNVAQGWSREQILSLLLLPNHVLVLKPTSLQLLPLPDSSLVTGGPHATASNLPQGRAGNQGEVWHLPFRVDRARWSSPYSSHDGGHSIKNLQPLSLMLEDEEMGSIHHFRLRLRESFITRSAPHAGTRETGSSISADPASAQAPYLFPPVLEDELPMDLVHYQYGERPFCTARSGGLKLLYTEDGLRMWVSSSIASAWDSICSPESEEEQVDSHNLNRSFKELLYHTPLRRSYPSEGLSICEVSGRVAVGQGRGDIWVFGFGFSETDT
ncbi:hypothetical protein DACRYDRAFT_114346 [Dacryopinax primogenitus]|uniref:F-box domain-containing protein n=1 Tax=Dacryopinax primogenitus (strain DJM 731) TaxID=1858805 RepID=M5G9T7_DACPD|nr:uncharacterized protein DACRYDRAFT_114346 [Dacryopinax primogenitus]EJU05060.1 hypothetical protein DACRYDRAFT_114346 [Dacryopinax primogenitus]